MLINLVNGKGESVGFFDHREIAGFTLQELLNAPHESVFIYIKGQSSRMISQESLASFKVKYDAALASEK